MRRMNQGMMAVPRKRRRNSPAISSGPYSFGLAIAVGFSMFMRLAKDSARPSCGVADARIMVSERCASRTYRCYGASCW